MTTPSVGDELDNDITYIFTVIDNYGTNTEARQEIRELLSRHRTALLQSLLDGLPEKSPINMDTINNRVIKPQSFSHGYMAGRNEVINQVRKAITEKLGEK